MNINNSEKHAYMVGGGLANLAVAVYLIIDGGFKGENIHILEALPVLGGSNDGKASKTKGFVCRGGRMLNEETYENFWDLTSRIPSLNVPNISLKDEILAFDHANPTNAKARLIDKDGNILNSSHMGFNTQDRMKMTKLFFADENELDNITIRDWFDDHFFTTNFWYMWQTTFAWQEWSSIFEFKRYMHRMLLEYSRIHTLEGVTRTPYNQYDSVIVPIQKYLEKYHVDFILGRTITDINFADCDKITVNELVYKDVNDNEGSISLQEEDLVFFTNGCITDCTNMGDYKTPAKYLPDNPPSFELWRKIADKKEGLGNPDPFYKKPDETKWYSFTATFKNNLMLKMIEEFSGNKPGSGALMTFKDSSWRISIVIAAQPHFKGQEDQFILWGYGLYPDNVGDYVKKPMIDCTGEEILTELIHHLHFENKEQEIKDTVVNVIPVMLPYVDALFQPRKKSDRPSVVPEKSTNLALISQFVEIPQDMVFTEEYSVRAARLAVYKLLDLDNEVIPVTEYWKQPEVLMKAVSTSYK